MTTGETGDREDLRVGVEEEEEEEGEGARRGGDREAGNMAQPLLG